MSRSDADINVSMTSVISLQFCMTYQTSSPSAFFYLIPLQLCSALCRPFPPLFLSSRHLGFYAGDVSPKPRKFRHAKLSGFQCLAMPIFDSKAQGAGSVGHQTFRFSAVLRKVLTENPRKMAPRNFLGFGLRTP